MALKPEWAIQKLEEYLSLLRTFRATNRDEDYHRIVGMEEMASDIEHKLVPGRRWMQAGGLVLWSQAQEDHIVAAIGVVKNQAERQENWPDEPTIEIDTRNLHPWVWDAVKAHWEAELWGSAVEAAAKVINKRLQDRLDDYDVSETDAVNAAFGQKPRLQVTGYDGSKTSRSMQRGARALGEAVFSLWRNVEAHEVTDTPPEEAIEALAAMSAFARLIDEAELIEGSA